MKRIIFTLALFFAVTGCAYYTLVNPERHSIGSLYTVETQIVWSKATEGHVESWTVDGPILQAVRFVNGLNDGDSLLKIKSKDAKLPRFRAYMTPSDVLEFFVASVKSVGGGHEAEDIALGRITGLRTASINAGTVKAFNLRPTNFGTLLGFRFDLRFLSKEGLEREGMVVGVILNKQLYLIVYTGAREYYYPKYKEEVEYIVSSIKIQAQ